MNYQRIFISQELAKGEKIMINYNKNKLINKTLDKYYETFSHTLDTADFVPEKFNIKIGKYIFKNMRKVRFCFSVIFFTVFSVELLQGFFRVGILDIDDLAVNLAGARVGFGFFKATRKDDYVFLS